MSGFPTPPPSSSSEADAKVADAGPRTIELDEAKEIIAEMSAIVDDPANKEKIDGLKAQLQLVGTGRESGSLYELPFTYQKCRPLTGATRTYQVPGT